MRKAWRFGFYAISAAALLLSAAPVAADASKAPVPHAESGAISRQLSVLYNTDSTALTPGQPYLLTFFAPDCRFCRRQLSHMQQLAAQCSDVGFAALGINGSKTALRSELKAQRLTLPAYLPSTALLRQIGGVAATPLTLILDQHHSIIGQYQGYMDSSKLGAVLNALQHCQA